MSRPLSGIVHALCVGLCHRWAPERLFMPMAAYIDESGTHQDEPVMILAGYVSTAAAWASFETQWARACQDAGVPYIHARKIAKGGGIYAHLGQAGCTTLVRRCNAIADAHIAFGVSVALKKSDYRQYAAMGGRKGRGRRNSPYGVCFRTFLGVSAQVVREHFSGDADEFAVFYESGAKNAGCSQKLWKELEIAAPELYAMIPTVAPVDKAKSPPVQAADVLAYISLLRNRRGVFDGEDRQGDAPPIIRREICPDVLLRYAQGEDEIVRLVRRMRRSEGSVA